MSALVFGAVAPAPVDPANGVLGVFDFSGAPVSSVIQVVLTFVIPILVGLVTDKLTDPRLKVVLTGGLSFATAFLNGLLACVLAGTQYDWVNALVNGLLTWLLGIVVHYGIWKPTGVTAAVQASTAVQLVGPKRV